MIVGVVGLGRFGSFWAGILAKKFRVIAYDREVDRHLPPGVDKVDLQTVCGCDALFLCVTIRALPEVLELVAPHLKSGMLVADTCSVKTRPRRWMLELLPADVSILATHPMFGPESGKDSIEGLALMMDPVRSSPAETAFWRTTFSNLGLKVVIMNCDQHDREAAYSQALTHFIGRSLVNLGLPQTAIATRWFEQLYAISRQCQRDAPELFQDMQTLNPYAADMRRAVQAALVKTMTELGDAL